MRTPIYDFEDGDFCTELSDSMAMDSDGDLLMRLSDSMALDMESGDIHFVSCWTNSDDD